MRNLKLAALASVLAANMLATPLASASSWQLYSGGVWSNYGTVVFSGPFTATVAGTPIPCIFNYTMQLVDGTYMVTSASFSGSTACNLIQALNLPWAASAPIPATGNSVYFTIAGIGLKFGFPPVTCTGGAATLFLDNANPNTGPAVNNSSYTIVFPSSPCVNVKSNPKSTSDKPIRAVL